MAGTGGESPISRRQLHDELLERLRDVIIEGELAEDAKVPEKELCERFGVSRTPLREALKVLAFEGLIVLNHNRGAVVKPLTISDLDEAFPIYSRLEALAGELACERIKQEDIDTLRVLHEEMEVSVKKNDLRESLALNERIHTRLQAASHNDHLLQLLRYVSTRVRRARRNASLSQAGLQCALLEHEKIMAALERRDAANISGAIRDHIDSAFQMLKDNWIAQGRLSLPDARKGTPDPA